MAKQLHVYYSGSVQGVGFRFMAERAALSMGLTGWVKNLPDGRVEVLCEGEESVLNEFLKKIASVFDGYIHDADIDWKESKNEFSSFDIRF